MIPYMGHNNAIDRYFWRAAAFSLLLHLLLGVWFVKGITVIRQVDVPQVILVELRDLTPSPYLAKTQEVALRRPAVTTARYKIPATSPLPPQVPTVRRQVPSAVISEPARPVVTNPSVQAVVTVVRATESHRIPPSLPTMAAKPDVAVVRPVEQAVPIKDSGLEAAVASAYFAKIRSRLERNKEYPVLALRGRIEGIVTVRFIIRNDGTVASVWIAKSSGYNLLDQSAIRTVNVSAPFPYPPKTSGSGETSVSVPLIFKMDM